MSDIIRYKGNRCSIDFEESYEFNTPICSKQETNKLEKIMKEQGKTQRIEEEVHEFWDKLLKYKPTHLDKMLMQSPDPFEARQQKQMAVPPETVQRHLLNVIPLGNLSGEDMFNLLSFHMNLNLVHSLKRRHFLDLLRQRYVLTNEMIAYLELMAKRRIGGISREDANSFLKMCSEIKSSCFEQEDHSHDFNCLFRSEQKMDLRELKYLKNILKTTGRLRRSKYLYLLNTVEILQDLPKIQRDQFFHILNKYQILKEPRLYLFKEFLLQHGRPFDSKKLRILLYELEDLMGLESQTPRIIKESPCIFPKFLMDQDLKELKKSIESLKKGGIPNIVYLKNFTKFITTVLSLTDVQMNQYMKQLKCSNSLTMDDLMFTLNFIAKENIEGADVPQLNKLIEVLKNVCDKTIERTSSSVSQRSYAKQSKLPAEKVKSYLSPCDLYHRELAKREEEEKERKRAEMARTIVKTRMIEGPKIVTGSKEDEPTCEQLLANSLLLGKKKRGKSPKQIKTGDEVLEIKRYDDKQELKKIVKDPKDLKSEITDDEKAVADQNQREKIEGKPSPEGTAQKDTSVTKKDNEPFSQISVEVKDTTSVTKTEGDTTEGETVYKKRKPPEDLLLSRSRSSAHSGFLKIEHLLEKPIKLYPYAMDD